MFNNFFKNYVRSFIFSDLMNKQTVKSKIIQGGKNATN